MHDILSWVEHRFDMGLFSIKCLRDYRYHSTCMHPTAQENMRGRGMSDFVFCFSFSLTLLVDGEEVDTWLTYCYFYGSQLFLLAFYTHRSISVNWGELTHFHWSEHCEKVIEAHIECSVLCILFVVEFMPELRCPEWALKWPISFPCSLAPRIPHFYQSYTSLFAVFHVHYFFV